ncbi:MAG: hypothetical protein FDZ70_03730 [Actinobacteria bacterium]|nr:MAG: hypothetical protein FDZ70_03730 [Actinomycetota bacterium]
MPRPNAPLAILLVLALAAPLAGCAKKARPLTVEQAAAHTIGKPHPMDQGGSDARGCDCHEPK